MLRFDSLAKVLPLSKPDSRTLAKHEEYRRMYRLENSTFSGTVIANEAAEKIRDNREDGSRGAEIAACSGNVSNVLASRRVYTEGVHKRKRGEAARSSDFDERAV